MTESASAPVVYSGRTAWARNLQTPHIDTLSAAARTARARAAIKA